MKHAPAHPRMALLPLAAVLLLACSAGAAERRDPEGKETPPASANLRLPAAADSVPALRIDTARIDSVFAAYTRPGSPGCVVAVMRRGEIVFGRGYGVANRETGERLSTRSVLDAASMAKQFVAFGILLLAEDGKLSLDDPVRKHFPELPDYGQPLTLRHLLHHTSGVRDLSEVDWLAGREGGDELTLLSRQRALNFAPGSDYLYSNTNYGILERVLERVSGQNVGAFQRGRIFGPLGMTSTANPASEGRRAHAYVAGGGGFEHQMGAGGFLTTPEDLARWAANFHQPRVGTPTMSAEMVRDARLSNGESAPYGLALHTEPYRGVPRFWHGGMAEGYRSQFFHYPRQGISVLTMCNLRGAEPSSLTSRVSDVVLSGLAPLVPEPATASPPADLARYAGVFVDLATGATAPVRLSGGKLELLIWATRYPLRPIGDRRFRVEGQPLTVEFREHDGGLQLAERWDGRASERVFRQLRPAALTPSALADYAGVYVSPDLGTTWRVTVRDGALHLGGAPGVLAPQRAWGGDLFTDRDGYMLVAFRRDGAGRVTGFTVSTPRARGMSFERRGS